MYFLLTKYDHQALALPSSVTIARENGLSHSVKEGLIVPWNPDALWLSLRKYQRGDHGWLNYEWFI